MKVFVTGVAGQLGHDVMNELAKRGYEGVGSDIAPAYAGVQDGSAVTTMPYEPLDITDAAAVESVIARVRPDVIVHCAAWTAVDLAEDEDKRDKVFAINAHGTENMAKACKNVGNWKVNWRLVAFWKSTSLSALPGYSGSMARTLLRPC